MRRVPAAIGSAFFLVLAPGTVAGLVPFWITGWRQGPGLPGGPAARIAGAAMVAVGVATLLDAFGRFALQGRGTPAPVAPPENLVVAWLATHLFVVAYEEPTLRRTFGDEYDRFRANVPRWIPRLRPWAAPRT